jgi:hypothetical protein
MASKENEDEDNQSNDNDDYEEGEVEEDDEGNLHKINELIDKTHIHFSNIG